MFEQAVDRFLAAVATLVPHGEAETTFALAVSGGPDSLALLLLGKAAFPGHIIAATVDHGLRAEAATEAAFVAALCAKHGVPHTILRPDRPIIGNVQSAARATRYALLQKWAQDSQAQWIITAHHSDDQMETLLMRIIRGSGVDGLASIRARNGNIIRPLLGFSKAELEAICAENDITPVRDPSNDNIDFDRVRLRQWLATTAHPFDPVATSRSANALAQASDALAWTTDQLANERIATKGTEVTLNPKDLPRELQRRLLSRAVAAISPAYAARGDSIEHSLDSLLSGKTVTLGPVLCRGGENWRFCLAPVRRNG